MTEALGGMSEPVVVFTAHSVPVSTDTSDPYEEQVARSAKLVAKEAHLEAASVPWCVAWQSAGRTEQEWLGPDLLARIDELAAEGRRSVVVCPIGFVSDHLEVLYDLDIEARGRRRVRRRGLGQDRLVERRPGVHRRPRRRGGGRRLGRVP